MSDFNSKSFNKILQENALKVFADREKDIKARVHAYLEVLGVVVLDLEIKEKIVHARVRVPQGFTDIDFQIDLKKETFE